MKLIARLINNLFPRAEAQIAEEQIPISPSFNPNKEDLEKELMSLIEKDLDEYDLSLWTIKPPVLSSIFLTHPNNKYSLRIFKSLNIIFSVEDCARREIYSSEPCKFENIKNQIWGNIYFRIKRRLEEINKGRELNKLNNFISNLKRSAPNT